MWEDEHFAYGLDVCMSLFYEPAQQCVLFSHRFALDYYYDCNENYEYSLFTTNEGSLYAKISHYIKFRICYGQLQLTYWHNMDANLNYF